VVARTHTAIREAQSIIHVAVAIVVQAIAGFGQGSGEGIAILWFTVGTGSVRMQADTKATKSHPQILVRYAIAVIVLTVANLEGRTGESIANSYFSFLTVRLLVQTLPLPASDHAQLFVDITVTVVVDSVTDIRGGPLEGITLHGYTTHTHGNRVKAGSFAATDRSQFLVGLSVTVVVQPVTDFIAGTILRITNDRLTIYTVGNGMSADTQSASGCSLVLVAKTVTVIVNSVADFRSDPCKGVTDLEQAIFAQVDLVQALSFATRDNAKIFVHFGIAVIVNTVA
jgi:hypothetical protein